MGLDLGRVVPVRGVGDSRRESLADAGECEVRAECAHTRPIWIRLGAAFEVLQENRGSGAGDVLHVDDLALELARGDLRPTEVETLLGDSSKAREKLGWTPEITLGEMVSEMVREDLKIAERDELCKREGFQVFDYNE